MADLPVTSLGTTGANDNLKNPPAATTTPAVRYLRSVRPYGPYGPLGTFGPAVPLGMHGAYGPYGASGPSVLLGPSGHALFTSVQGFTRVMLPVHQYHNAQ